MIYNRIAVLRAERSLTRQVLAREVGVNPQTIGFLERGDYTPSLELAFAISRFFKLPIEAVFSPDPFRPLSEQVYAMERRGRDGTKRMVQKAFGLGCDTVTTDASLDFGTFSGNANDLFLYGDHHASYRAWLWQALWTRFLY
jgi:putative transcriptional regulator